jgi:uncharacterized protein YjbJ (UPF0337 family)
MSAASGRDTAKKEAFMSAAGQRAKGVAEEVSGKLKKAAGKILDNEQMEAEGRAQELKGEARQEAAKGVERAKGSVEQAAGAVKAGIGRAVGNPTLEADGQGDKLKGAARKDFNR